MTVKWQKYSNWIISVITHYYSNIILYQFRNKWCCDTNSVMSENNSIYISK